MHTDKTENLGQKIKLIRLKKGYKQEYVALKLGMSQTGYSKIETGETSLSVDRAAAIAQVLGMSLIELIQWKI